MAETKTVTYKSRHAQLSIARVVNGKRAPIHFTPSGKHGLHGEFSTSDADTQKFIEKLESFRIGIVAVKPEAEVKADADEAEAERKRHAPAAEKQRLHYEKAHASKVEARKETAKHDAAVEEANRKVHAKQVAHADSIKHKPHLAAPAPAKQAAAK